MIWALIEVVLPMLLTFLFGLFVGWLWWRHHAVNKVASNVASDVTTSGRDGGKQSPALVDNSVAENASNSANEGYGNTQNLISKKAMDDRLSNSGDTPEAFAPKAVGSESAQQDRLLHEQALAKELTAANANIRSLVADLDVTRTRLQSCEKRMLGSGMEVSTAGSVVAAGTEATNVETAASGNVDTDCSSQLRQLQAKYQQLEASQSIDKAKLAKNHHLESRLHSLTKELTENKSELADAKKAAGQLQAKLDAQSPGVAGNGLQGNSTTVAQSGNSQSDADQTSTEVAQLKSHIAEITPVAEQARDYQSQVAALQARLQQSESKVRQIEQSGERIDHLDSQLQTRLADELEKAQQQVQSLKLKASQSTEKAAELVRIRSRVATLESELGEANSRGEDAEKLQQRVAELEAMLKGSKVKVVNERLVEAEAQLRIANNRVAEQQQQISRLQIESSGLGDTADTTSAAGTENDESDVGAQALSNSLRRQRGLSVVGATENNNGASRKSGIAAIIGDSESDADQTVAASTMPVGESTVKSTVSKDDQLAKQMPVSQERADTDAGADSASAKDSVPATGSNAQDIARRASTAKNQEQSVTSGPRPSTKAPSWQAGVTKFGTPAARHKDDLKVIRGIGPVLERTLNEAEIQTWDQLAALTVDEVGVIEQSIDFPGRMTREHWVEQARELVELYPDTSDRPTGKNLLPKKR